MLTIYKASAGSGKTYTLTLEYIKLLLGRKKELSGDDVYELMGQRENAHRSILAVTFTNKATEEMKRRIVKELSVLALSPEKSAYISELKSYFRQPEGTEKISQAALNALYSLLFKFSYFNVSTIDSFFQQVLRTFANEIDRPGNFDIELDEDYTLGQGISTLLDSLASGENLSGVKNEYLKKWLKIFMTDMIDNGRSFNLFNRGSSLHVSLVRTMGRLLDEKYRINSDEIGEYLDNPERLVAYNKALTAEIEKILSVRSRNAEEYLSAIMEYNLEKFSNISLTWLNERIARKPGKPLGKTLLSAISTPSKTFKATSKIDGITHKCPPVPEHILNMATGMLTFYDSSLKRLNSMLIIRSHLFYMGLLGALTSVVKDYCRDNNMILISDTNELLDKIIGDDITPFIYERMGVRLRHFLIDEFQDTSRMQWNNFIPLLFESLSHDHDNLIIGDEKQCIYRFRNSAPELLGHEVSDMIGNRFNGIRERGLKIEENRNWRSAREIVMFNNSLFYVLGNMNKFPLENAYHRVIQEVPEDHADKHGYVEIDFIRDLNKGEQSGIIAEQTVKHVKRLLEVYSPGDIAILVKKNDQAKFIVDALLNAMELHEPDEHALPKFEIISNQALAIDSAPSVKLIVNILKLVDMPEDVDAETPDSKQRRFKNKADMTRLQHRYEIFMAVEGDSDSALVRAADSDDYTDSLLDIAMDKSCNDVETVVERIITHLPVNLRERDTIFLTAFQDQVLSFMSRGTGDIHSFLNWWEQTGKYSTIDSPEGSDALTVTTIHKSKGIEYPCVIVPFADWLFSEDSSAQKQIISWHRCPDIEGIPSELTPPMVPVEKVSKLRESVFAVEYESECIEQRTDALNLMYVAFTRAVDELIIISAFPYNNNSEGAASYIESAIKSLSPDSLGYYSRSLPEEARRWIVSLADKYDEVTDTFKFGVPRSVRCSDKQAGTGSEPMPLYESFDNSSLMRVVKVEQEEDFDPENARVMGNFMHSVMSRINDIGDLEFACRSRAAQVNLPEDLLTERIALLREMLNDPRVSDWFTGYLRVVNERPLTINDRHTIRPDRVVWTADGHIDVVDYKFGEIHDKRYADQVQQYVDALRGAGYENVRGYIWYPLEKEVITVDDGNNVVTLF